MNSDRKFFVILDDKFLRMVNSSHDGGMFNTINKLLAFPLTRERSSFIEPFYRRIQFSNIHLLETSVGGLVCPQLLLRDYWQCPDLSCD